MKKNIKRKASDDFSAVAPDSAGENLPQWDLSGVYEGFDDPDLAEDIDTLQAWSENFQKAYGQDIARLNGDALAEAISDYEEIVALTEKITRYCYLVAAADRTMIPQSETFDQLALDACAPTDFFEQAIANLREQDLMTRMSSPDLARYAPWIAQVRAHKDVQNKHSSALQGFSSANAQGWRKLYDDTMSAAKVEWQGQNLTLEEALSALAGLEAPSDYKALRGRIEKTLKSSSRRITFAYNVLLKDQIIEADMQGLTRIDAIMLAENGMTPAAADAMRTAVKSSFHRLSHRFYAQKGAGEEPLAYTPWEDAQKTVLRAFRRFSPRLSRWAQKLFDGHIDAAPATGKQGGAFSMPMGGGVLPFILLNYDGTLDGVVSSLAHEVGHGVHQSLCDRAQGALLSKEPTTISETASIFAEMLTYDELLRSEKDPATRQIILGAQVDSLLRNGLEQLSYYEFEKRAIEERRKGELTTEQLSVLWMECQREFYGPAHVFEAGDELHWMTVPHFIETPFYVFSYSFAQMLAASLFEKYKEAEAIGDDARKEFVANYIALLETGMTKNVYETLQPFGLDPDDPSFWESGLLLIEQRLESYLQAKDNAVKPVTDKKNKPAR